MNKSFSLPDDYLDSSHCGAMAHEEDGNELKKFKQRAQTEKARIKNLINRKEQKQANTSHRGESSIKIDASIGHDRVSSRNDYKSFLQHFFFTKAFETTQQQDDLYRPGDFKSFFEDRARAVYSLIQALVATLISLFSSGQPETFHVICANVVDDTNVRMRTQSTQPTAAVYTVMNSVQNLHVRRVGDSSDCSVISLRIPTPLLCLENATADTIYWNFISSAFFSCRGMGQAFVRYGIPNGLLPQNCWRTFIFCGDLLRANESAFKMECKAVSKSDDYKYLALKFKCLIHQLALIRKPCVLMIPKLWTTVVRLSHLYESLSFRRSLAVAMASVVIKSFIYLPMDTMPPESPQWKTRSGQILQCFRCRGKRRKAKLNQILEFLNGDLNSECIFHFCSGDSCCKNQEDALNKCLELVVPFFSRGYPVPLLYRFKHYDEAISFISVGTDVHSLLSRSLLNMSNDLNLKKDEKNHTIINKLLGGIDLVADAEDGTAKVSFTEDMFEEESFQEQNAKRKQLVYQEFSKPEFKLSAAIVDLVVQVVDIPMNKLLKRSGQLTTMTLLGVNDPNLEKNIQQSRDLFLSVVSGEFGSEIVRGALNILENGLEPLHCRAQQSQLNLDSSLQSLFTMVLHLASDAWRRFVHHMRTPMFQMLSLLKADLESFVASWDRFQMAKNACPKCFELEFCEHLLAFHTDKLADQPISVQREVQKCITLLLTDISTYAPLSSDSVEIRNGQVQIASRRFGTGAVKAPQSARETSFLQTFIRGFEVVKHSVEQAVLPSKQSVQGILRQSGIRGTTNQFTKKDDAFVSLNTRPAAFRFIEFSTFFFWRS